MLWTQLMEKASRQNRRTVKAFWMIVELHRLCEVRLSAVRGISDRRRQILRGLLRAATAISHVEAGRQLEWNLSRAAAAIDDAETGLLLVDHLVADDFVDVALASVSRIVEALEVLSQDPCDEGPTPASAPSQASAPATLIPPVVSQFTQRMSAVLRSRLSTDNWRRGTSPGFTAGDPSSQGVEGTASG
jgi:hypothetical protein